MNLNKHIIFFVLPVLNQIGSLSKLRLEPRVLSHDLAVAATVCHRIAAVGQLVAKPTAAPQCWKSIGCIFLAGLLRDVAPIICTYLSSFVHV